MKISILSLAVCSIIVLNACSSGKSNSSKDQSTADNMNGEYCTINTVVDGDTVWCTKINNKKIKVRLGQIDAPEIKQPYGNTCTKKLSDYIAHKKVTLVSDGTDKYGRTIAQIYLNNDNINTKMVADGCAWAYRYYLDKGSNLLEVEKTARNARRGLWSQDNPVYPREFRNGGNTVTNAVKR